MYVQSDVWCTDWTQNRTAAREQREEQSLDRISFLWSASRLLSLTKPPVTCCVGRDYTLPASAMLHPLAVCYSPKVYYLYCARDFLSKFANSSSSMMLWPAVKYVSRFCTSCTSGMVLPAALWILSRVDRRSSAHGADRYYDAFLGAIELPAALWHLLYLHGAFADSMTLRTAA